MATVRFGMLETIREFALDQLVASGELDEVARRHAAYFADLVQRRRRRWWDDWSSMSGMGLFDLETEQANIRAALGWLAANDPIAHVRMAGPSAVLVQFGHLVEGRRWLDGALTIAARLGDALPAADHAKP